MIAHTHDRGERGGVTSATVVTKRTLEEQLAWARRDAEREQERERRQERAQEAWKRGRTKGRSREGAFVPQRGRSGLGIGVVEAVRIDARDAARIVELFERSFDDDSFPRLAHVRYR